MHDLKYNEKKISGGSFANKKKLDWQMIPELVDWFAINMTFVAKLHQQKSTVKWLTDSLDMNYFFLCYDVFNQYSQTLHIQIALCVTFSGATASTVLLVLQHTSNNILKYTGLKNTTVLFLGKQENIINRLKIIHDKLL